MAGFKIIKAAPRSNKHILEMRLSTWVESGKLLNGFQRRRRVFGDFRTPAMDLGTPGFSHLLDFVMISRNPDTKDNEDVGLFKFVIFYITNTKGNS